MFRMAPVGLAVSALLLVAGCSADEDADPAPSTAAPTPGPTPESISPTKLAIANLLPVGDVPPAPPGSVVETTGPVRVTGEIGQPHRQYVTCTLLEVPTSDDPGPLEPDAAGAASSNSIMGVAQVDQYAVVYTDDAAADAAVERARGQAEDCDASFAVHSPDSDAQAEVSAAPGAVEGFRVHATYASDGSDATSDETSAVLRSGRTVLYIRANETGSGQNAEEDVDGTLDPAWSDQLVEAAANHLAE
jgi:hypothetical protein